MFTSALFDLIDLAYLTPLRDKIETENGENSRVKLREQELGEYLTEEQKFKLTLYRIAIIDELNELHAELGSNVLNLGIKIGMQLQEAFSKLDE